MPSSWTSDGRSYDRSGSGASNEEKSVPYRPETFMDLIYGPAILRLLTVAASALAHTGIQTRVVESSPN